MGLERFELGELVLVGEGLEGGVAGGVWLVAGVWLVNRLRFGGVLGGGWLAWGWRGWRRLEGVD